MSRDPRVHLQLADDRAPDAAREAGAPLPVIPPVGTVTPVQPDRTRKNAPAWQAANDELRHLLGKVLHARRGALVEWAARLGVVHQRAARFFTVDGADPFLADVALLPLDELLAFLDGWRSIAVRTGPRRPLAEVLAHVVGEFRDVEQLVLEALVRGGGLSTEVRARLVREIDEAIDALRRLRVQINDHH